MSDKVSKAVSEFYKTRNIGEYEDSFELSEVLVKYLKEKFPDEDFIQIQYTAVDDCGADCSFNVLSDSRFGEPEKVFSHYVVGHDGRVFDLDDNDWSEYSISEYLNNLKKLNLDSSIIWSISR